MKTNHPLRWPQPERLTSTPRLALFVYGTLRFGQKNHEHFCGNATQIQPATTIGRLYALPAGYPALEVPAQHILASGTANPLADAALQSRITGGLTTVPDQISPPGDWDLVHGEIITFVDPLRSLPPIDRLEGFHDGNPSYYERVLLPVFSNHAPIACWTYVMPGYSARQRLRGGIWPARHGAS